MDVRTLCGVGMLCAVVSLLIKNLKSDVSLYVRLAGDIVLLSGIMLISKPVFSYVTALCDGTVLSDNGDLLTKSLGTAMLTYVTSDICRECGEDGIATKIELGGRCIIMAMSLPLITSIMTTVLEMLRTYV